VLSDSELCTYISVWLRRYPKFDGFDHENLEARVAEQARLAPYRDARSCTRDQVQDLIDWKFQSMPHRRHRALLGISPERWVHATQRIEKALIAPGDVLPLKCLIGSRGGIFGFGPAMGSAVLAACRPETFTVADVRALTTLRAIGYVPPGPSTFRLSDWEPYVRICRRIATRCERSLREVDQALWAANGRDNLPEPATS
jgi:hypothetical protein